MSMETWKQHLADAFPVFENTQTERNKEFDAVEHYLQATVNPVMKAIADELSARDVRCNVSINMEEPSALFSADKGPYDHGSFGYQVVFRHSKDGVVPLWRQQIDLSFSEPKAYSVPVWGTEKRRRATLIELTADRLALHLVEQYTTFVAAWLGRDEF